MTREVKTDAYVGGLVIPDLGSIHPGLYHAGLVRAAIAAGARLQENTEVLAVERDTPSKRVVTSKGTILARDVIVATNGYTTPAFKWLSRRLVPFRGFMIATEVLPPGLIDSILPERRVYTDTLTNLDFYRPAPDSERVLFGAMTGTNSKTATPLVPQLYKRMVTLFPDLKGVKISRCWTGICAGTFDLFPHIGSHDGIHFASGYNYSGLPAGTYFGQKLAARILGAKNSDTLFDALKFPMLPFYNGSPVLASLSARYFDWQDRKVARSA